MSTDFLKHLQNPRNPGRIDKPDAEASASNPACGDQLVLTLRVHAGVVREARFQASGCAAALAAASAVTELLANLGLAEVPSTITPDAVEAALGGLPANRRHAAVLASQVAIRAARSAQRLAVQDGTGPPHDVSS